jgi:oligoendopeptidase F
MTTVSTGAGTVGQERDRAKVDAKYTWDLSEVYPDVAAWRAARTRVAAEVPHIRTFAGRLGSSAQTLADALDELMRLDKEVARLYVYAGLLADEDTRLGAPQGMQQEMQQLYAELGAQASYVQPEVLRIGRATVEQFLALEPRLGIYAFYLRDIVRRAAHTLSDAEEKLLADAGPLAASAANIYGILANADFPYPTVTLKDGRRVTVDQAGYAELRTRPERHDRQAAMSAFFGALGGFSRTFGTTMNSSLQKAVFYAKARMYESTLEAALDRPNIPVSVYLRLIEGVNRHLPTFHRYLRLRKRMMGVADDLHYYDLYAPLVASVSLRYTPEEAQQLVMAASAPLGGEYVSVLARSFGKRWLD